MGGDGGGFLVEERADLPEEVLEAVQLLCFCCVVWLFGWLFVLGDRGMREEDGG